MSATSIVAIDGPAGSGKSSVSKAIARRFDLAYVDSGATYRAVTWWVLQSGMDPEDSAAIAQRCGEPQLALSTDPDDARVTVDGRDVSLEIRQTDVTEAVSAVSAVPEVRRRMVDLQRACVARARGEGRGCVVEGRDIASVVLPDADVKVYLTADTDVRAHRRALEDAHRTGESAGVQSTGESLALRDAKDSSRTVSPLMRVDDAVHIDATDLSLEEVVSLVAELVEQSAGRSGGGGFRG